MKRIAYILNQSAAKLLKMHSKNYAVSEHFAEEFEKHGEISFTVNNIIGEDYKITIERL